MLAGKRGEAMTDVTYKIHQNPDVCDEEWKEVVGERVGQYLAVRPIELDGYVIDHIPTGLRIGTWSTAASATTVARSICDVVDWSQMKSGPDTDCNKDLLPKNVRDYLFDVRGQHRAWPLGGERPQPPKVLISFELDADLSVDDLWPDGDWPDEITEQSVKDLIYAAGGPEWALRDWGLAHDLRVSIMKAPDRAAIKKASGT